MNELYLAQLPAKAKEFGDPEKACLWKELLLLEDYKSKEYGEFGAPPMLRSTSKSQRQPLSQGLRDEGCVQGRALVP